MLRSTGSITILNSNLATGTATNGSTVGLWVGSSETAQSPVAQYSAIKDQRIVTFAITGTWTGTIVLQETLDGVNWYNNGQLVPKAGGANVASTTGNGAFQATITCSSQVRVTASAAITGTAVVVIQATGGY